MGEVSHAKVLVAKPRPLGLVKSETVRFEDVENNSVTELEAGQAHDNLYFVSRSKTDGDLRHGLKSMRELQETLRQAALLNIVAAVNHDNKATDSLPPTRAGGTQSVGIKGANILRHTVAAGGNKSLFSQDTVDYSSVGPFSRHLHATISGHSTMPTAPPPTAATPNTALNQLLNSRSRTISIPRPRTHGDQSFMHKSLLDAKEQLANMTNFRNRAKNETDSTTVTFPVTCHTSGASTAEGNGQSPSHSSQLRAATPKLSHISWEHEGLQNDSYALRGMALDTGPAHDHNMAKKMDHQSHVKHKGGHANDAHTSRSSKDEQRAQNVHQMQALKRHISTSKKKELVKRLTEIAKCEAIDISEPVRPDSRGAQPMLILASRKDYSRHEGAMASSSVSSADQRVSSMTPLPDRDETARVPSNSRVQSETLEAMAAYREAKRTNKVNIGDDFKIDSNDGMDPSGGMSAQKFKSHFLDDFDHVLDTSLWAREHFLGNGVVGKTLIHTMSPDVLELRPIAASPTNRNVGADKKRLVISKKSMTPIVRDKLISPSPVVYEASYHRPKATISQISLVGQSLPSMSVTKSNLQNQKAVRKSTTEISKDSPSGEQQDNDLSDRKQSLGVIKPWGSTSKQPNTSAPILRTEIVDHLQCVGIVDKRPVIPSNRKSISKVSGINKVRDHSDDDLNDEDYDRCSETSATVKVDYRKSKLYSAFRASEENLANLAEASSLVSEALTTRSLLNQPIATVPERHGPPKRDPVQHSAKEPLYMGCSSKVPENEIRSQFHYVNSEEDTQNKPGTNFRVFKALDQDVYFDFQHRKYRNTNNSTTLNTAPNKPRMHFLKIKYSGEAKS